VLCIGGWDEEGSFGCERRERHDDIVLVTNKHAISNRDTAEIASYPAGAVRIRIDYADDNAICVICVVPSSATDETDEGEESATSYM